MKRLILSSLPLLFSVALVPAAHAQVRPEVPPANAETIGMAVTPFNLVYTAYSGRFEREGIPKFNRFLTQYQSRQLTAEDLVRAAIQARRLPDSALSDRQYLSTVELQRFSPLQNQIFC